MPIMEIGSSYPFCPGDWNATFQTYKEAQRCGELNLLRTEGNYSIRPVLNWSETWPDIDWRMKFTPKPKIGFQWSKNYGW